ncbi:MAG: thioesterase family protein [Gammaproteobacteria bacterium]|nr:thioesterase family protein [Gammaproteobacteria bacterium]
MNSNANDDPKAIALQQLTKAFNQMPFNQLLGLHLKTLTQKQVIVSFNMKEDLVGNFVHGILHGGVISSVLDMVGGMAAMATIIFKNPNTPLSELTTLLGKSSTIDLHVSYMQPGKGSCFTATSEVMHSGNRICFTTMNLLNENEAIIASGTGTYQISAS